MKLRHLVIIAVLSATSAAAQSMPPVPGIPVDSGNTWIIRLYSGTFCNKVDLANGETWAIGIFDYNAQGRWETLNTMYLKYFLKGTLVRLRSTASSPFNAATMVQPVTLCLGGPGAGVEQFANPAQVADESGY